MEFTVIEEDGRVPVTIIRPKGEINAQTADEFLTVVRQETGGAGAHLLLDLSEVSYISSWGVRALSEIHKMLSGPQGAASPQGRSMTKSAHLKLLCPTPQVQRVLSATGLDLFLDTYTERQKAVASF